MEFFHKKITYNLDGTITEESTPWVSDDFVYAIKNIEEEITPRRLRESILSEEGRDWLFLKNQEIETLRNYITGV